MTVSDPNSSPKRLLFIGNSYTQRNDLPGLLTVLGAAAAPVREIVSRRVIENGASLRRHWNAGEAVRILREEPWDAVVLQEQSTLPVKNRKRYHENVRLFHEEIRRHGSRTVLYHTWARQIAPATQADLDEAVFAIAQETGSTVVPAGRAWTRYQQAAPALPLYDPDGSHPTLAGSYLAACTFFATLFHESPEGLPAPSGVAWSTDETRKLQQSAWAAVTRVQP